tara:strand:+ start:115703 stop:115804 length:102 start_codon:yes stop_codon:yes gene_type:complete
VEQADRERISNRESRGRRVMFRSKKRVIEVRFM